ncbi:dihydrodipicolinate synthase family protein [Paraburkholderia phenazinium]|uniref:4-hydroxy-tetrahydrodipicolinate synthase n=1 Tax=Paraburkholderia phenazinium TaxID=60549 RepID=A0A1N6I9Q1_9BURK|nr:dihydrodipicolinate synthase family protein [Paraburkholderia phenazinium]SIO28734.1 4-hydroxy-tetrahydrodipicolinate synthase [Paraburkholderia phenazinium]
MHPLARRYYTALVLPTNSDFTIDEGGLRRLTRYFMQPGFREVGGLIVNPEAGEIFYLDRAEKRRAIEIVLDEANGEIPVFAGLYGSSTSDLLNVTRDAKAMGVDGIFVIPPGGAMDITYSWDANKYPEVWLDQIKEQDAAVDLPILTHPVAPPSPKFGVGLPLEPTLKICREVPNIIGWKMTYSYDGYRVIARALREQTSVGIMGAPAHFFHEAQATGQMDGTVSGCWCYAMEPMLEHLDAWKRGDLEQARQIWDSGLAALHEYIFSEWGRVHVRYKVASWLRGLTSHPRMRPPMPEPRQEEISTIRQLLTALNLPLVGDVKARQSA